MALGDITSVEISPSGAEPFGACADITIDGFTTGKTIDFGSGRGSQLDYADIASATIVFTVVSEGYDSTGALGTVTRTLYGTSVVRKPYPNQADDQEPSATVIRVALSDFVYDDDNTGAGKSGTAPTVTIAAGAIRNDGGSMETSAVATNLTCTNSSTLDYPQTIARWDRVAGVVTADRVTAAFTMACRAYNRSGIACVRFDATGQTSAHNENSTATTRTATQRVGSGLWAEAYHSASTALTSFTDDELIDLRFRAYPVVGDADSIRDTNNHTTSTEECLGYNKATIVCDKDNDSNVYAVVSSAGNNTTGVSSATLATAEASPYLNIFEAIKDGANVIYLLDGTHDAVGGSFTRRTTNEWVVVTYHPTLSSKAGAIVQATSTNKAYLTQRLQYRDLTFRLQNTTSYMDGSDAGNFLRLTSINFDDDTTGAPTTGLGYRSHATYVDNCTGDMGEQEWDWKTFSTAKLNYCFDGCDFGTPTTPSSSNGLSAYELVATSSHNANLTFAGGNTGGPEKDHIEIAFNSVLDYRSTSAPFLGMSEAVSMGVVLVGNVIEKTGGTSPLMQIAADSATANAYNAILWHNTFTGERYNAGYNDIGGTAILRRNWSQKYNSFRDWNNKDDTFGTANAARTGSWPVGYGVGFQSNNYETSTFPGEYGGFDLTTGTPGYVDDNSYTGSGTGNGDYTPDTGSVLLARIPLGRRVVTIDLFGNSVVDGGDIGAIQVTSGPASSGSTGWVTFQSISQGATAAADWSNLANALDDDTDAMTVSLDGGGVYESEIVSFYNINYGTTVPLGAASYTVSVRVRRTGNTSGGREINDLLVKFRDETGTAVGDNMADTVNPWLSSEVTKEYVFTGLGTMDGSEFDADTGFVFQATGVDSASSATASVFYADVKIDWVGLGSNGAFDIPVPTVSGAGSVLVAGYGNLDLPTIEIAGSGSNAAITGTGNLNLPVIDLAGAGSVVIVGSGNIDIPVIEIDGGETPTTTGWFLFQNATTGTASLPLIGAWTDVDGALDEASPYAYVSIGGFGDFSYETAELVVRNPLGISIPAGSQITSIEYKIDRLGNVPLTGTVFDHEIRAFKGGVAVGDNIAKEEAWSHDVSETVEYGPSLMGVVWGANDFGSYFGLSIVCNAEYSDPVYGFVATKIQTVWGKINYTSVDAIGGDGALELPSITLDTPPNPTGGTATLELPLFTMKGHSYNALCSCCEGYTMRTLIELRRMLVQQSGHAELVADYENEDWADNGADHFIQAGQRFCDDQFQYHKSEAWFYAALAAGESLVTFTNARIIKQVWLNYTGGNRVLLERLTLDKMREEYTEPLLSDETQGTPAYWVPAVLGLAPQQYTETALSFDADGITDHNLIMFGNHYPYKGIYIMPPADGDYTVEIKAEWYSYEMCEDSDVSFWSQYPELILMAARRQMEIDLHRNSTGAKDFEAPLMRSLMKLSHNLVAEEWSGPTKVRGEC